MISESLQSELAPGEVLSRLKSAMAGGNFEILSQSADRIEFRHGTYLTQSAPLLPKRGFIRILPAGNGSRVDYEIGVSGFAKYWQDFALKHASDRELRMESLGLGGVAPTPQKNPFSPHQSSNPPQILALLASGECFA